MLEFSEISIDDKSLFDKHLNKFNPQASELTFTNLFMWRNYYKFRYTEVNDFLCIISVPNEGTPFSFIPLGDISSPDFTQVIFTLKEYFEKQDWKLEFKRVTEDELMYFDRIENMSGNKTFDRDHSDYIYLAKDLIELKGKKYDGKRNHINKFNKLYEYEYISLNKESIGKCFDVMEEWCSERSCEEHRGLYCEKLANTELINNFDKLGCRGALIKVDGEFKAFTIGEMQNDDTAVIHLEKASGQVQGLYTLTNQKFCENEWSDVTYINREQDIGIEGIRKAKLSYNPIKMINKYTVSFD